MRGSINWRRLWRAFWVLVLGSVLVTGRTIGDHAVEIRFEPVAGRRSLPAWMRRVLRILAGIGGLQLLGLAAPADLLFLLGEVGAADEADGGLLAEGLEEEEHLVADGLAESVVSCLSVCCSQSMSVSDG